MVEKTKETVTPVAETPSVKKEVIIETTLETTTASQTAADTKLSGRQTKEQKVESAKAAGKTLPSERKKRKKKKFKGTTTKAKKKTAVARAVLRAGTGRITINKQNISLLSPRYVKDFVYEPLGLAGELSKTVDIHVTVRGSGFMSQAAAARAAIAKSLIEFSKDKKLKDEMLKYDRMLLVDDSRRKEAKKPLGRGARKKKQLSKR